MRGPVKAVLAGICLFAAGVAHAQQVPFTGQTRANTQLIHDIMQNVVTLGRGRYHCAAPDAVEAQPAPPDFAMSRWQSLAGTASITYERWNVSLCGTIASFAIGYWPASDGSFLFAITEWPAGSTEANAPRKTIIVDNEPPDDIEALKHGADGGDAVAQLKLGDAYRDGRGVPRDAELAMQWFRKSADAGNTIAMNNVGAMYEHGSGVARDYEEAAKWYRKAAEQDNALAQLNLGTLYAIGRGVPQDYAQAMAWWQKSAAAGNSNAQFNIGELYFAGYGVPQDYAQALSWFHRSAGSGNPNAQRFLGTMYEQGLGVPQDYAKAQEWYTKAADQGDEAARQALAEMAASGHAK